MLASSGRSSISASGGHVTASANIQQTEQDIVMKDRSKSSTQFSDQRVATQDHATVSQSIEHPNKHDTSSTTSVASSTAQDGEYPTVQYARVSTRSASAKAGSEQHLSPTDVKNGSKLRDVNCSEVAKEGVLHSNTSPQIIEFPASQPGGGSASPSTPTSEPTELASAAGADLSHPGFLAALRSVWPYATDDQLLRLALQEIQRSDVSLPLTPSTDSGDARDERTNDKSVQQNEAAKEFPRTDGSPSASSSQQGPTSQSNSSPPKFSWFSLPPPHSLKDMHDDILLVLDIVQEAQADENPLGLDACDQIQRVLKRRSQNERDRMHRSSRLLDMACTELRRQTDFANFSTNKSVKKNIARSGHFIVIPHSFPSTNYDHSTDLDVQGSVFGYQKTKPRTCVVVWVEGSKLWIAPTYTNNGRPLDQLGEWSRSHLLPLKSWDSASDRQDSPHTIYTEGRRDNPHTKISTDLEMHDISIAMKAGHGWLHPDSLTRLEHYIREDWDWLIPPSFPESDCYRSDNSRSHMSPHLARPYDSYRSPPPSSVEPLRYQSSPSSRVPYTEPEQHSRKSGIPETIADDRHKGSSALKTSAYQPINGRTTAGPQIRKPAQYELHETIKGPAGTYSKKGQTGASTALDLFGLDSKKGSRQQPAGTKRKADYNEYENEYDNRYNDGYNDKYKNGYDGPEKEREVKKARLYKRQIRMAGWQHVDELIRPRYECKSSILMCVRVLCGLGCPTCVMVLFSKPCACY